jgi:Amt family ammonium transporter
LSDFRIVGISTPAAGYVPVYVAPVVGGFTSLTFLFVAKYKYLLRIDEGLDIFAIYGVLGGVMGDILTGFFASKNVPEMDRVEVSYSGGWSDQHYVQMGYQSVATLVCASWSFTISVILLFIIDRIPGCRIRVTEQEELEGVDEIYLEDGPITGYCYHKNEAAITYGVDGSSTASSAVGIVPSVKTD